jgi:hypothetical protein
MPLRLPVGLSSLGKQLNEIGFERTRRALAGLGLSAFVTLYLLVSLNAPEGLAPALVALAACYAVAFVAVVAEWFWGRWFASGLGWSGIMVAIASLAMLGWTPALAIFGGVHVMVVVALAGNKMAVRYDLQEGWRQRYKMDEFGVARLRKTVTRAAASLPSLIFWALGPKEGQGLALGGALAALALAAGGLRGVIRMRTWGVVSLGAACLLVALFGRVTDFLTAPIGDLGMLANQIELVGPTLGFVLLAGAVLPFARPLIAFLRNRAS